MRILRMNNFLLRKTLRQENNKARRTNEFIPQAGK
jgi:hypothetical protein